MKQHSTSIRVIAALAVALGVSACAAIPNDTVTRAAMIDAPQRMAPMLLDIQTIRIDVPRTLEVSEKNRFYPGGDIVWRGEPMGDRYMQVGAIFEDAATRDPATGVPLSAPRRIKADLKGYGGKQAIAADQRGQTQKIRITDHLSQVIRTEMMSPGSYHTTGLGLMGALNTF